MVLDARAAGMVPRWRPGFLKSGKSGERFQFYSKARTLAQFDAMTKELYLTGVTGASRSKAVRRDLVFDVDTGDGDTSEVYTDDGGDGGGDGANDDFDGNGGAGAPESSSGTESVKPPDQPTPSRWSSPVWFGRHRGRRTSLRAAKVFVRKGLTADEATLLEEGLKT